MSDKTNKEGISSMSQLFLSDLKDKTDILSKNILDIEQGGISQKHLDALSQTIQSVKAGAGLAKLELTLQLATVMQEIFTALEDENLTLNSSHINLLLDSIEMLHTISELGTKDDAEASSSYKKLMTELNEIIPAKKKAAKETKKNKNKKNVDKKISTDKKITVDSKVSAEQESPADKKNTDATLHLRELFYGELKEKLDVLAENLLGIEQGGSSAKRLEVLMRTAHSIKGGARLSKLEPAVNLAHVMEDIFVSAQSGELELEIDHIDILLETADHLIAVAEIGLNKVKFDEQDTKPCLDLTERLQTIINGEFISTPTNKAIQVEDDTVVMSSNSGMRSEQLGQSGVLRVSAQNMDRIIGLAGELSVEARHAEGLRKKMTRIRHRSKEVVSMLGKLSVLNENKQLQTEADDEIEQLLHKAEEVESAITENMEQMEKHDSHSAKLTQKMFHEVLSHRMRPFIEGVQGFHRLVRDVSRSLGKEVLFEIIGENSQVDRDILEKLYAPLTHLIQNAIDHAIELPEQRQSIGKDSFGSVRISARHKGGMLSIVVEDDGRGIDIEAVRKRVIEKKLVSENMAASLTNGELLEFLLLPNFTMKDEVDTLSGRGVGLDIVREVIRDVRGTVHIQTQLGEFTRFELTLPITLAIIRCVIIELSNELYALPVAHVEKAVNINYGEINTIENHQYFTLQGHVIGLVDGHQLLGIDKTEKVHDELSVIVLGRGLKSYGIAVDHILYEMDLVERPIDPRLGILQDISAAAFLEDGTPVIILDSDDLTRNIDKLVSGESVQKVDQQASQSIKSDNVKKILVVDDSLTVREVERNLLINSGYEVDIAVDGMDGWNAVRLKDYELVLTDIDMPRMDGIELLEMIRKDTRLKSMPVIVISYKDREEDRNRGMKAGADHYLTKGSFHDETLIETVVDLIGQPKRS